MFDIKITLPVDIIEEVEEKLDLLRRVLLLLGRRRQPLCLAGERLDHLGGPLGAQFGKQKMLKRVQMIQFECPLQPITQVGRTPVSNSQPSSLWGNKNWPAPV